jgi:hypothetical protein
VQRSVSAVESEEGGRQRSDAVEMEDVGRQSDLVKMEDGGPGRAVCGGEHHVRRSQWTML